MKITNIETLICDAGWRPWIFIKVATDEGLVGYSEVTDSHGSPLGIKGVVEGWKGLLLGKDPREIQNLYYTIFRATRQTYGGLIQKAWAGVENALWDIKGKYHQVPVYDLFGGKLRDDVRVYWSHCGTTRVRAYDLVQKDPIQTPQDLSQFAKQVKEQGYDAIKTNIILFEDGKASIHHPGFQGPLGSTDRNPDRVILRSIETLLGTWRESVGEDFDLLIDFNFNFTTEGYIRAAQVIEPFRPMWMELDSYDPSALKEVTRSISTPTCSGENLYGVREFRPYFEHQAMRVAMIDFNWNGWIQSKRIADMAESYEMNVAPHNYYSHFSTFMNAQFCAACANVRIMEIDVDDVPWKDSLVNKLPEIHQGRLKIPGGHGWGVDLNEKAILEHPWKPKV